MGLPYIKSPKEVKNSFMPLKAMAYTYQVTHSSPNDPPYQPPSYIYTFPYMSLQVDISADKRGKEWTICVNALNLHFETKMILN
jgi:hypothetical protein